MSRSSQRAFATAGRPRGRWLALALAACSWAILVGLAAGTSAARVAPTTVVLGQTSTVPDPSCPGLPCQAVGSVTGFQVSNGQTRSPFIVPHNGTIKAWTLTLAQPTNKQRSFFNGFFGTPPEARLAVLGLRHPTGGLCGNPAAHPRPHPAPLHPAQPGLGQGPHPVPWPDGQVRLLAEG